MDTDYKRFLDLLKSVDADIYESTGKIPHNVPWEEDIPTKDITLMGSSCLSPGIPCLRFDARTEKFLGGWCDEGHY